MTIFESLATQATRVATTPRRRAIAREIADEARAAAPVLTGEYRDGIGVEFSGTTVRVVDDDPEAFYKEYGTVDTPAHAVLTDAARRRGRYRGYAPQ
ncbi:HK97 gp10 family phage protein [Nocardia cyriacigeorgica]|uniref:HK97 gp10 family phage protein n=1 Tax=Nocardia cyriacigeorgica TaxID=135487 RepID=A0ABX0CCY5_9NOCA|nr:HK97 gp10 family phage protein [Nocardia cyriacigeorgica]NEW50993.1 HK97 gp10 family phage protein [Nocardia cyriacigeorgica]NEW54424.1 HK97 gp10 family phage protein [Nocardia cyriacigeorgica]